MRYPLPVPDGVLSPATAELPAALGEHRAHFLARFGAGGGVRLFFSPGRVNLVGAHLDYNGGPVLPTAIDRGTFFAVRARADDRLTFASVLEKDVLSARVGDLPPAAQGRWFDYPLGVVRHLLRERERPAGIDVLFGGNLAVGAGLSSSASICVGTAFALDRVWGLGLDLLDLLAAALWGERSFVGVQCGIMDPYAVGLSRPGHLLWLDCKDGTFEHLPLPAGAFTIAVADTGVRRQLAQGEFNRRVTSCREIFARLGGYVDGATCLRDIPAAVVEEHASELDPPLLSRARHVTGEVERTFAARDALVAGDLERFGRQLTASHRSLRDLYEVSAPELDLLVESAVGRPGCLGARLTGAGFGGCAVILVRDGPREDLAADLAADFARAFGRRPAIFFFRGDGGPRELAVD
ncbi:MAG: galactokinase [Planctomycetota bacterium]